MHNMRFVISAEISICLSEAHTSQDPETKLVCSGEHKTAATLTEAIRRSHRREHAGEELQTNLYLFLESESANARKKNVIAFFPYPFDKISKIFNKTGWRIAKMALYSQGVWKLDALLNTSCVEDQVTEEASHHVQLILRPPEKFFTDPDFNRCVMPRKLVPVSFFSSLLATATKQSFRILLFFKTSRLAFLADMVDFLCHWAQQ